MFNYNKPGKGVSENQPEMNCFALYFAVLWRKLRKFFGLNLLYLSLALPLVLVIVLAAAPWFAKLGFRWENARQYLWFIMMYLCLIGIAPINIGAVAIFKKYSRQEHAWMISEFFEAIKENFKTCLGLFVLDIIISLVLFADYLFLPAFQGWSYIAFAISTYFITFIYIAAHFYVYQIILMFDVGPVSALKNAIIIAIAKLPQSFLIFIMMVVFGSVANNLFTFLITGFAPVCFIANVYSERLLTKKYIDDQE